MIASFGVDRVRVVESRDEQAAVESRDELVATRRSRRHEHVDRKRPPRVRRRQPVARRNPPLARRGLGVVHEPATYAVLHERHPLLRHALVVEGHRQTRRVTAIVDDRHEVRRDPPVGLPERAALLHGERREPEVTEHVEQVDDCVFLEDDGVVARLDRDGVGACPRLGRGFAADRGCVDRRCIGRCRFRVPGAAVGTHRDREQLRRGPILRGADTERVGDRDRLGRRRERAVGGDPGRIGRGDDRADTFCPELRRRVRRGVREGGRHAATWAAAPAGRRSRRVPRRRPRSRQRAAPAGGAIPRRAAPSRRPRSACPGRTAGSAARWSPRRSGGSRCSRTG